MAHWFITVTTYGTWLPGDPRGSVGSVRDRRPEDRPTRVRRVHNIVTTPYEKHLTGLHEASRKLMKGPPVRLDHEKAEVVLDQFLETSRIRNWQLFAVAIMWNHFHLVAAALDEVNGKKIRNDLKAYASGALNRRFGKPPSDTWWTTGGSVRPVKNEDAYHAMVNYTLHEQPNPLVVWSPESKSQREPEA
jgi:REP element-mobilizing transposase RayT